MRRDATAQGEQRRGWLVPAVLSYLTVLGLATDLALQNMDGNSWLKLLLISFGGFSVSQLLLFVGLCFFYHHALIYIHNADGWKRRDGACVLIPSGLFAAFMVVGYSFAVKGSVELVVGNSLQMVKSLVMWNGYFIVFSISIAAVYTWLSTLRLWQTKNEFQGPGGLWGKYRRVLVAHPFLTCFVTLLLCYLPYMILSYPGILMGDSQDIIPQGYNIPNGTASSVKLIDEAVQINGHHPVVYTELLHLCLVVGKAVFGSYNVGVFFTALLQTLVLFAAISAVMAQLIRLKLRPGIATGLLAYYILAPRVQNYFFLITKDVMAAAFLLLFLLFLFRILAGEGSGAGNRLGCFLSGLGVCLFRNEGRYVVLACLVVMLILAPRKRRQLALPGVAAVLAAALFFHGVMPALHITSGSSREMLSVPFQQTARYVRDHGDEVTDGERRAIAAILDYDSLAQRYNPELSDPVKATYHKSATKQELMAYFKIWLQMGLKHPDTYIQATMHNYYIYFYPGPGLADPYTYGWSTRCMDQIDRWMGSYGYEMELHHPEVFARWRQGYETLRERTFELPLLSLLRSPAAYVWGLMLAAFYWIKRKQKYAFTLLLLLLFILGVCLLGPTNGNYFRYLYSISLALPPVFFLGAYLDRKKAGKD